MFRRFLLAPLAEVLADPAFVVLLVLTGIGALAVWTCR